MQKIFPGGFITIAGANSPTGLRSHTIRILLADEIDAYPASAGKEGDPLLLASKKTDDVLEQEASGHFHTDGQGRIKNRSGVRKQQPGRVEHALPVLRRTATAGLVKCGL